MRPSELPYGPVQLGDSVGGSTGVRLLPPPASVVAHGTRLWSVRVSTYALRPDDDRVLDEQERARADRFVRPSDRHRYRVAHVALRRLLGDCLGVEPAAVRLVREPCPGCGGPHGRPAVHGAPLHFSLSHAADLVLVAVADTPVGADVEEVPTAEALPGLVGALHPLERAGLDAVPEAERPLAFARCWTRKEACLKGTGIGLADDPAKLQVGTGPQPLAPAGWLLADVTVDDGYAAACAVRERP